MFLLLFPKPKTPTFHPTMYSCWPVSVRQMIKTKLQAKAEVLQ